jgi:outer membrane protein assembly factor BamB
VNSGHDWRQFGYDLARSGVSTAPTGITASNVGSMSLQQVALDGTVDASAIYLSDVTINGASHAAFFVTTIYGKTIAVNANTGAILWTYTPAGYSSWAGSAQVTTATPVADPNRQYIYAASPDGNIQKLAVANGQAAWMAPITESPQSEKIASSLSYFAGHIIAVTGGYVGDAPPYQGHVVMLDAGSGQVLHVWNALCSGQTSVIVVTQCAQSGAAIWGRGGAVVDSTTGHIYVATGNGYWDGKTNWGDAMLELDSTALMIGNYTPTNTLALDRGDLDLGSTSPALLAGGNVVLGGKDGQIRVVTPAAFGGASAHTGGESQIVPPPGGDELFTALTVFQTTGGTELFAADNSGTSAWTVSNGQLSAVWSNGNEGTSPVVAGGLLFIYDPTGGGLRVYQPATGAVVATLPCGGGHWNSPIVADGRIALPEGNYNNHQTSGVLDIWRAGR